MKFLLKSNVSGETIATTNSRKTAEFLTKEGGIWLISQISGDVSYRWYAESEDKSEIYSPKWNEWKK